MIIQNMNFWVRLNLILSKPKGLPYIILTTTIGRKRGAYE